MPLTFSTSKFFTSSVGSSATGLLDAARVRSCRRGARATFRSPATLTTRSPVASGSCAGGLTAYDAAYVALAEALDSPLLTRDAALGAARGHRARIEVV